MVMSIVGKLWFWSQRKDKYSVLMEKAKEALLRQAPIGSKLDTVVDVLRRQNYDSSERLDEQGVLTGSYQSRLNDLTWRTGPASWDLTLFCRFEAGELKRVDAEMRPTGL